MRQAEGADGFQHKRERPRGVTLAAFPGDDGVADMAVDPVGEFGARRLPAKTDAAADFAVPEPAAETRQPGDLSAVREGDRAALGGGVVEGCEEPVGVRGDLGQFFCDDVFRVQVAGRPAAPQGGFVAREMRRGGAHQFDCGSQLVSPGMVRASSGVVAMTLYQAARTGRVGRQGSCGKRKSR